MLKNDFEYENDAKNSLLPFEVKIKLLNQSNIFIFRLVVDKHT